MILQRFRVERILGAGGMGEVLLAHDTLLGRRVALKRLRPEDGEAEERRAAILREARRAGAIHDHRIAAIYDVLSDGDDVLIVMEYVDGTTLRARMDQPLALEAFWPLSMECAEAVGAAHAEGLVHRDIKPENLMLTAAGGIKILDFGIARRVEFPDAEAGFVTTTTTTDVRSGIIAGTPQYMAPEAHYGGRLDRRSDIFSLGVVFYELLTGRRPFEAPTYEAVLTRVMNAAPEPVHVLCAEAGPGLAGVVAKMLEKDPAARFATCGEVAAALETARREDTARAMRPLARAAGPRPWWTAPAAALGVIAAVFAAWLLWTTATAPALPAAVHLAVLPPQTPDADDDFANWSLGAAERLASRLRALQNRHGFQLAPFAEGYDEKLGSAADARRLQGANVALASTFATSGGRLRATLELRDVANDRMLGARTIEAPESQPFAFLDRLERQAADLLHRPLDRRSAAADLGIQGAGTLRFLLQGIGRRRGAKTTEDAERAVRDLELACRAEPEAATPRSWLAAAELRVHLLSRDPAWLARADSSARRAVALDSTRAESYRVLGAVLDYRKQLPASIAALERAIALDPVDEDVWRRLARAHGRLGHEAAEESLYHEAIRRYPDLWAPRWWLASYESREGRMVPAIQAAREMIRRAPDLSRGYANLGGMLVLEGAYGAAVDTLQRAIALHPTKEACNNLGTAYFNAGRLEDAIAAYNQSFQFGFEDYGSWLNLGDAYFWLRDRPDQAREAYLSAVRLGRDEIHARAEAGRSFDVQIPANLATVFPKLAAPDSARAYLSRALAADSTNMLVQAAAALTCWQLGERSRALAWMTKAVAGGYPRPWLRDSPVFQEWREDAAFRALSLTDSTIHPVALATKGGGR